MFLLLVRKPPIHENTSMTLEPNDPRLDDENRPKAAPAKFAGQWVAWNRQQTEIVANGGDFASVHKQAKAAGHTDAVMQRVPQPCSFIGGV